MAKKIQNSDLFADDLFKVQRQEAEQFVNEITKLNSAFKEILVNSKEFAKTAQVKNVDDVKKLAENFEAVKVASDAYTKSQEQLQEATKRLAAAQKGEVDELTKTRLATQAANTETKRLAREQLNLSGTYDQMSARLNNLRRRYKDLAVQNRENTSAGKALLGQITALDKKLKDVDASVGQNQRSVGGYKEALKGAISGFVGWTAAIGIGVKAIGAAIQAQKELELSLANLRGITGASAEDLKFYRQEAQSVATAHGFMAKDVVEAYKLIGSAKPELLENKFALADVAEQAIILANASGLELPEAASRLTDAMNQFRAPAEDAGKFINILAEASKLGAAEVPDLTESLLKAGSAARTANVSFAETSAILEAFSEFGLKGAEAGTQLRNVLLKISTADALPKEAVQLLQQAGVNIKILSDNTQPLQVRLAELAKIQGNAAAISKVFGTENFNAATILIEQRGRVDELTKALGKEGLTTAYEQAALNTDTLTGATNRFKATLDNVLAGEGAVGGFFKTIINGATDALLFVDNLGLSLKLLFNDIEDLERKDLSTILKIGETESGKKIRDFLQPFENIRDWDFQKSAQKFKQQFVDAMVAEGETAKDAGILFDQYIRERTDKWIAASKTVTEATTKIIEKEKDTADETEKTTKVVESEYTKRLKAELDLINKVEKEKEKAQTKDDARRNVNNTLRAKDLKFSKDLIDKNNAQLAADQAKRDKDIADEWKKRRELADNLAKVAQGLSDILERQAERRKQTLDREFEASQQRQEDIRALAIAGNADAQASLAAEQKRQAEIELQREREIAKQKRRELGLTAINTYNAKIQQGDPNALGSTIRDLTLLSQVVANLPLFYEGTENVAESLGKPHLKGRDGYIVRVDGSERIVDGSNNNIIPDSMDNDTLAKVAQAYSKGHLVGIDSVPTLVNNTIDISALENKLNEVKKAIESKPVSKLEYDTINKIVSDIMIEGSKKVITKQKARYRA